LAKEIIWRLTEGVWKESGHEWPGIIGRGLVNYTNNDGKPDTGDNRLFAILMSGAAHLIWRIRYEWRIQKEGNLNQISLREEPRTAGCELLEREYG